MAINYDEIRGELLDVERGLATAEVKRDKIDDAYREITDDISEFNSRRRALRSMLKTANEEVPD